MPMTWLEINARMIFWLQLVTSVGHFIHCHFSSLTLLEGQLCVKSWYGNPRSSPWQSLKSSCSNVITPQTNSSHIQKPKNVISIPTSTKLHMHSRPYLSRQYRCLCLSVQRRPDGSGFLAALHWYF